MQEIFEIVIASNRRGKTFRFSISDSGLKALAFFASILLLLTICCLIDYPFVRSKREAFKNSLAENVKLKDHLLQLEKRYSSEISDLTRIHSLISKLRVITKASDNELQLVKEPPILSAADAKGASDFDVVERTPSSIGPQEFYHADDDDTHVNFEGTFSQKLDLARQDAQAREQEMIAIWESLSDREALLASTPTIKPANGYYSSRFGYRVDPFTGRSLLHAGLDIAAPYGSTVHATADGIVTHAGWETGYGNLVSIDNGFGLSTRFGHNSRVLVKVGQRVHRGDPISLVGSTGRSTGPHVHYEVRVRGLPVDPANYILQDSW